MWASRSGNKFSNVLYRLFWVARQSWTPRDGVLGRVPIEFNGESVPEIVLTDFNELDVNATASRRGSPIIIWKAAFCTLLISTGKIAAWRHGFEVLEHRQTARTVLHTIAYMSLLHLFDLKSDLHPYSSVLPLYDAIAIAFSCIPSGFAFLLLGFDNCSFSALQEKFFKERST